MLVSVCAVCIDWIIKACGVCCFLYTRFLCEISSCLRVVTFFEKVVPAHDFTILKQNAFVTQHAPFCNRLALLLRRGRRGVGCTAKFFVLVSPRVFCFFFAQRICSVRIRWHPGGSKMGKRSRSRVVKRNEVKGKLVFSSR